MQSLLFAFLDELLFLFSTESFVVRELALRPIVRGEQWELRATGCARVLALCTVRMSQCSRSGGCGRRGCRFVPGQHEQGTEVRRCTRLALTAHLTADATLVRAAQVKAITYSAMQIHERESDAEVFVIVDI
jgi:SHS2 domain-containing protein